MNTINSNKAPIAIGPYSQATEVGGLIYISGQLPIDATTGKFLGSDIKSQAKQSLENIIICHKSNKKQWILDKTYDFLSTIEIIKITMKNTFKLKI